MTKVVQAQVTIAATPQAVFQALTQTQAVKQWFAEHAAIDPLTHQYDFWGRYTFDAPDRAAGRHPIVGWEPGRRLTYIWTVRGADTTVDITLTPVATGTQLQVTQEGVSKREDGEGSLADFWTLSLENLRGWVEQGGVGPRCDFGRVQFGEVRLGVDVAASAEAVYATLVEPALLERYIASHATVEPWVGGRYDYGWGMGPIKILDITPTQRLSYSWQYDAEPDTVVTWSLEESGGRTRLTLVHSGFGDSRRCEDYQLGWGAFLAQIKYLVECGAAWHKVTTNEGDYALA